MNFRLENSCNCNDLGSQNLFAKEESPIREFNQSIGYYSHVTSHITIVSFLQYYQLI